MPSTGKPSRACYRCRQRRIKCDLGQPECHKCLRLGQPCPGYRKESELMFQNESQKSYSESILRDRRKANISNSQLQPSRTVSAVTSKVDVDDMAAHIALFDKMIYGHELLPPNLAESWDDHAIPFVISLFSAPTRDGERFYGFMDFFPDMIAKVAEASPMRLCCKAIASVYFNNRYDTTAEGTNKRVAVYGRALRATNSALGDRDLCLKDETLVSIWLLSIYETLCGATMSLDCPGRPPNWNTHILGLVSLVRMRARPQFLSGSGRRFFWMIMGVAIARSLAASVECPKEILNWLEDHITDFVPEELDMNHILIHGYHATILCAEIRRITTSDEIQGSQTVLKTIEEARKLGRETEASVAQDPLTRPLHLRQAHVHNYHRAVRIHIHYSILELLQSSSSSRTNPELTPQFVEKQQKSSISTIQTLTQDTLSTIPYVLGPESSPSPSTNTTTTTEPIPIPQPNVQESERERSWVDGFRILWPLRVIGSRKIITTHQRKQVERTLQRLATDLHIRSAVVPYAIPKHVQLNKIPVIPLSRNQSKIGGGCKTCRRRKVKCDAEKPVCDRCRVARLDCGGYERDSPTVVVGGEGEGGGDEIGLDFDQGLIGRVGEEEEEEECEVLT